MMHSVKNLNSVVAAFVGLFSMSIIPNNAEAKDDVGELTCESVDYKYRSCKPRNRFIYEIGAVQRMSDAPCIIGDSYGINSRGAIFVSKGCRAKFVYRWSDQKRPIEGQTTKAKPRPTTLAQSGSYFVARRFYCRSKTDGDEARDVTVSANSPNSCNDACAGYEHELRSLRNNPCVYGGNAVDLDLKSYSSEWIHAGPCQGQTC